MLPYAFDTMWIMEKFSIGCHNLLNLGYVAQPRRKRARKASGVTMAMPSYMSRDSKSGSRVTTCDADAATAHARIMSSLGSRTIPESGGRLETSRTAWRRLWRYAWTSASVYG